jgi:hypothetical protein
LIDEEVDPVDELGMRKALDALVHRVHKGDGSASAEPSNVENSTVFPDPERRLAWIDRLSRVVNKG